MNNNANTATAALIRTGTTTLEEVMRATLVVSEMGELIKNRNGPAAPDNRLGCTLSGMFVTPERIDLHFPEHECCDMGAAIRLCVCVSPEVAIIQTWSGEKLNTRYQKDGDDWKAIHPSWVA